jgi:hypothetical protein
MPNAQEPPEQHVANPAPVQVPTAPQPGLSVELREILEFNERENQKHRDYFQML